MSKRNSRKTTEEMAEKLDLFQHHDAAERLRFLQKELDELKWRMEELKK